jgi:hypothetical protein
LYISLYFAGIIFIKILLASLLFDLPRLVLQFLAARNMCNFICQSGHSHISILLFYLQIPEGMLIPIKAQRLVKKERNPPKNPVTQYSPLRQSLPSYMGLQPFPEEPLFSQQRNKPRGQYPQGDPEQWQSSSLTQL